MRTISISPMKARWGAPHMKRVTGFFLPMEKIYYGAYSSGDSPTLVQKVLDGSLLVTEHRVLYVPFPEQLKEMRKTKRSRLHRWFNEGAGLTELDLPFSAIARVVYHPFKIIPDGELEVHVEDGIRHRFHSVNSLFGPSLKEISEFVSERVQDQPVVSVSKSTYPSNWGSIRAKVLKRDNHTCANCRACSPTVELHVHHIVPLSRGGTNEPSNLMTLCRACHDRVPKGR